MPPIQSPDVTADPPYTKRAGTAPLPGYVLIEPLGRGGFGEVWKCEVPGGLHKAIKFVAGGPACDAALLRQEFEAFQQVKAIRHPFLLCLERVELVGDELVMVMGLADRHIGERFYECAAAGLPGIPRDELLGYLREAAEALDVIGERYGLQHLDVKPANLFLTAGHVQVGDYGLVCKLSRDSGGTNRGLTPQYAAPEVLLGEVHTRSDQYSLALVYQELLTGTFPFPGRTAPQIMLQHMSATPDLSGLPESDRGPIAVALAKRPEDRFPSCRDLIDALTGTPVAGSGVTRVAAGARPTVTPAPVAPPTLSPAGRDEPTQPAAPRLPRLVGIKRPAPRVEEAPPPPPPPPAAPPTPSGVRLPFVISVVPVEWLRGREAPDPDLTPDDMVRAVLGAAGPGAPPAPGSGAGDGPGEAPWCCRFLTTIDPRIARVKLELLREPNAALEVTGDGNRVVLRLAAPVAPVPTGLFGSFTKKAPPLPPSGFEVEVQLPETGSATREGVATGRLFGAPPPGFARAAADSIRELLDGVRETLGDVPERRKHPRVPARFPVTVFPVHSDGRVETPLGGHCLDVSAGGVAVRTTAPLATHFAYLAFDGVRGTTALAVLVEVVRTRPQDNDFVLAGRFRLDLWYQ